MPDDDTQGGHVSQLHAVRQKQETTPHLHFSRAQEYVTSQLLGVTVAMGSVMASRRVAPQVVKQGEKALGNLIERYGSARCHGEELEEASRKTLNLGLMLGGGLATSLTGQTLMARRRREKHDTGEDISLKRDVTRILTGWSLGAVPAIFAYYLAERYGRAHLRDSGKMNSHALCDIVSDAEKLLDKHLLGGMEYAPGNKISEGLVANGIMVAGAVPATVAAQQLYDSVIEQKSQVR